MTLFHVGGRFPGDGGKISKNWVQIRIPGPKLPIWASFYTNLAIFKKWHFSTWEVDFRVMEARYQKTDSRFEFLAPNYLYEQVFIWIWPFLKNGIFPRGRSCAKSISSGDMHATGPTWHATDSQNSGLQCIGPFFSKFPILRRWGPFEVKKWLKTAIFFHFFKNILAFCL